MQGIAVLGSTGSIGTQTLAVLRELEEFRVIGLSAGGQVERLRQQLMEWRAPIGVIGNQQHVQDLQASTESSILYGEEGLCELAQHPDVDLVVVALVGSCGLAPTLSALRAGKRVALANKETLVAAGHLVMHFKDQIVPIDSEHSALWQCLEGRDRQHVRELVLTASGGPFREFTGSLETVTVEQAMAHPNWSMGGKISIDSATLMNKGLEVIEAHWLFNQPYDAVRVVVHPQSVVHSMIRFLDGSFIAQMGATDMRLPIQYALTYPQMRSSTVEDVDLTELPPLTFEEPDYGRFPCLGLAYAAGKAGGSAPVVLNAANEVAVQLFLAGRIGFSQIAGIVEDALSEHHVIGAPSLATVVSVDKEVRERILRHFGEGREG